MDNNHAFQSSKFLRALLVLFFMTVSVQWTFAQLDLNMSRTTLGTVIEQIKTQSKYQFFYDDKLAATAVEKVNVKNASIEDALTAILKGKNANRAGKISRRATKNIAKRPMGFVFCQAAARRRAHTLGI